MLSTTIVVFREILEAALVLGVLLAATRGLRHRGRWVFGGTVAGTFGAMVVAFFTENISNALQGMGQEIFNAIVLFLAASLIGWHVIWMKRSAPQLSRELKAVGQAVTHGQTPVYALAIVAFLAVLREGSEIVLFVYGIMAGGENLPAVIAGSGMGLIMGCVFGVVIYFGLIKVPTGSLFSVTSAILILLASGMVSQALGFLSSVGVVPAIMDLAWDTSRFLSEQSLWGKVLHSLVGYTARPSGIQVVGYWLTLGGIVMLLKFFGNPPLKIQGGKGNKAVRAVVAAFVVVSAGIFGLTSDAHATKKVYGPHVEQGELELEYRGGRTFDKRDEKDNLQKHKVAVGYGVTEHWFTEVYGEWEKHPQEETEGEEGHSLKYEATEWENRFQISEPGEWWIDTGFYAAYEFVSENKEADKLEMKILLEKSVDQWTNRANLTLEKAFGGGSKENWEAGAAWSTSLRLRKEFEPGVELHWEYGEFNQSRLFDEQTMQVGPVAYGKLGEHIKYDAGYLFGVSSAAPEGELKCIVEFEWRFN